MAMAHSLVSSARTRGAREAAANAVERGRGMLRIMREGARGRNQSGANCLVILHSENTFEPLRFSGGESASTRKHTPSWSCEAPDTVTGGKCGADGPAVPRRAQPGWSNIPAGCGSTCALWSDAWLALGEAQVSSCEQEALFERGWRAKGDVTGPEAPKRLRMTMRLHARLVLLWGASSRLLVISGVPVGADRSAFDRYDGLEIVFLLICGGGFLEFFWVESGWQGGGGLGPWPWRLSRSLSLWYHHSPTI
jgi:hypothetical protein